MLPSKEVLYAFSGKTAGPCVTLPSTIENAELQQLLSRIIMLVLSTSTVEQGLEGWYVQLRSYALNSDEDARYTNIPLTPPVIYCHPPVALNFITGIINVQVNINRNNGHTTGSCLLFFTTIN